MASKIMSDPAPIVESDMPESSTGREPQGITINQGSLRNLLECITQILQQISTVQMNPQELGKEDTEPPILLPGYTITWTRLVQGFQRCILVMDCDQLLEMVNSFDAKLFLQTFDKEFSRSALHVAVLKGSQTLFHALMEKLRTLPGRDNLVLAEHDFILKADKFGLSAADMADLIGNKEIFSCFSEVFGYESDSLNDTLYCQSPTSEDEKRNLLEKASPLLEKPGPAYSDPGTGPLSIREWLLKYHVDFVYCLHEAVENKFPSWNKALEFVEFVYNNGDSTFLEPLFNVRGSLGKSPLHVCNDEYFRPVSSTEPFHRLVACFPNLDWNMPDFSGRTPLHWAAAQGFVDVVTSLASKEGIDLNATYGNLNGDHEDKSGANFMNGDVGAMTPLHLAVIHNHFEVVEALMKVHEGQGLDVNAICNRDAKVFDGISMDTLGDSFTCGCTPFQLAAYMGHERILQVFLKDSRSYDPGLKNGNESAPEGHNMVLALHLAASQFHPSSVKALVACRRMDILVKDKDGNTALHYAAMHAHGLVNVYTNLYDYVTVSHFTSKTPKPRKPSDHDMITCIDILMQSRLDMEKKNKDGITPTLHLSYPENVQNWWLQKMAKEAQENKNNLIAAANVVSVTAALVATTSFVGPLQPPLGLLDDGNPTWLDGFSQVKHTSVEVFLFCVSLSFYLAIAAIVFAMLPSWPIPHEGLAQEVRIARRCVQVAVLLLFGSIIFVVCAFSAASIAIVPNQQWRYKTLVVISTSLGVLICFLILLLSFMRLLTLISSRNELAKKISNVATQIMLWERDASFAK